MTRILYVTAGDPTLPTCENNGYYIGKSLSDIHGDVVFHQLAPFTFSEKALHGAKKLGLRLAGREYRLATEPRIIHRQVDLVVQKVHEEKAGFVFSNGPNAVAGLGGRVPYAFYSDAPISGLLELGHFMKHWTSRSIRGLLELDRKAVEEAELVFYHTDWAADVAVRDYGVQRSKLRVVSPGANFDGVPPEEANVRKKKDRECRLLFFGRAWERKGGPIAYEVHNVLRKRGLACRLIICGPQEAQMLPVDDPTVEVVRPINKGLSSERLRMSELFRSVDYLLLPTRADTSTSAIREASAFGVPSVSTNVGGIGSLVTDGIEGFLLRVDSSPAEYADRILENYQDDAQRLSFRAAARAAYEDRMRWSVSLRLVVKELMSQGCLELSSEVATKTPDANQVAVSST
jgi:glycosyltransferase involved in cell wall biosynthesis